MKILHLDSTHSYLCTELEKLGFTNLFDFKSSKNEIENKISNYNGIIIDFSWDKKPFFNKVWFKSSLSFIHCFRNIISN